MLFDTDIFIWIQKGNLKAAHSVEKEDERFLSIMTYMELLQSAQSKQQHDYVKSFIKEFEFQVLSLTENIGHRSAIYIEEYSLAHSLRAGDAIIAATATENNLTLCTSNAKHFKPIKELKLNIVIP